MFPFQGCQLFGFLAASQQQTAAMGRLAYPLEKVAIRFIPFSVVSGSIAFL